VGDSERKSARKFEETNEEYMFPPTRPFLAEPITPGKILANTGNEGSKKVNGKCGELTLPPPIACHSRPDPGYVNMSTGSPGKRLLAGLIPPQSPTFLQLNMASSPLISPVSPMATSPLPSVNTQRIHPNAPELCSTSLVLPPPQHCRSVHPGAKIDTKFPYLNMSCVENPDISHSSSLGVSVERTISSAVPKKSGLLPQGSSIHAGINGHEQMAYVNNFGLTINSFNNLFKLEILLLKIQTKSYLLKPTSVHYFFYKQRAFINKICL